MDSTPVSTVAGGAVATGCEVLPNRNALQAAVCVMTAAATDMGIVTRQSSICQQGVVMTSAAPPGTHLMVFTRLLFRRMDARPVLAARGRVVDMTGLAGSACREGLVIGSIGRDQRTVTGTMAVRAVFQVRGCGGAGQSIFMTAGAIIRPDGLYQVAVNRRICAVD